jgi:hypothetical protein
VSSAMDHVSGRPQIEHAALSARSQ